MITVATIFSLYKDPPTEEPGSTDKKDSTTTAMPGSSDSTDMVPKTSTVWPDDCPITKEEYNDLQDDNANLTTERNDLQNKRDAYLATMIVFIILFVIAAAGCVYLFMKNR